MSTLTSQGTWELTRLPDSKKLVYCRWIFSNLPEDRIEHLKAYPIMVVALLMVVAVMLINVRAYIHAVPLLILNYTPAEKTQHYPSYYHCV